MNHCGTGKQNETNFSVALQTKRLRPAALILSVCMLVSSAFADSPLEFQRDVRPTLEKHCFGCHGAEGQKSDLRIDTLSTDLLNDDRAAETWHDILSVLNLGEMPPDDQPALNDDERRKLIAWLTLEVQKAVEAQRNAGSGTVLRRLNRVEYQNTMRDLLGIDADYSIDLPPDSQSSEGFLNNGSILGITDMQLEVYLDTARRALQRAIVIGQEPTVYHERITETQKDKGWGPWTNMLGRTGTFVLKLQEYPREGEFVIRVRARALPLEGKGTPILWVNLGYRADVDAPSREVGQVDVVSQEIQTFEFRGRIENYPMSAETGRKYSGLHVWLRNSYDDGTNPPSPEPFRVPTAQVVRPERFKDPDEQLEFPQIVVESLEFVGPCHVSWPPPEHQAILFPSDLRDTDETADARQVIRRFIARAFRRPVKDGEIDPFYQYYESVRPEMESFEEAMRETLAMVLVSPDFLYLVEDEENNQLLNDHALAARLSYFLHGSMPDDELRSIADAGELCKDQSLRDQTRRMLADERAWQFIDQFSDQWLDLGAVNRVAINPEFYPDFNDALKDEMRSETKHFFAEVLRSDVSALAFLDSDFAMLNSTLARHYGIPGPKGARFERTPLKEGGKRGGLLTQGAFLLGNSEGSDSHPIKRAVWIRTRLLDDAPSPPPPNVPSLDTADPNFAKLSIRHQLELHRTDPACADCHRGIDPWGIALEEFGADGLVREQILRKELVGDEYQEFRVPVDMETTLPDDSRLSNSSDLKRYLLDHERERFARTLTTRMLSYALGRSLGLGDESTIDELTQSFVDSGYLLSHLIEQIVLSETFRTK